MARGRDQREPMERLVRLMAVLSEAGEVGVPGSTLVEVAGFDGADAADQLAREFRHLRKQGWQIDNIGAAGLEAVWRLKTGDSRLRLRLGDRQQAALQRAVLLADREDLVKRLGLPVEAARPEVAADLHGHTGGAELAAALRALHHRAVLRFRYAGRDRVVHPASVRHQNNQWYLSGREDGDELIKHFVVQRMSQVGVGEPGSAERVEPVRRLALHPLRWEVDPPVEVTLEVPDDYLPDVVRWLQAPAADEAVEGAHRLTYVVTHRAAMRARIYLLGERVRVVGPEDFRAELVAELAQMAGVER